ncbi:MAG TPA: hypothetical protein DDW52_29085 [Planctomycetaceae bacterium]|nr:hypothetical protein [Planctomycetaceae bacterium]
MPVENGARIDPAQLALLAFHEGLFDGGQLRRVVRYWVDNPGTDLREILTDEGLDAAKVSMLQDQLIALEAGHAINAPHFSQIEQHSASTEDRSTNSPDASVEVLDNSTPQPRALASDGDNQLSRSSKKKDRSGAKRLDYYDSVHEQFTRDDRLFSSLIRSISGFHRKLWMDLRRFTRSSASLLDIFKDWLRMNYRSAIIGVVVIALLIPLSILASQFIRPSKERTLSRKAADTPSVAPAPDDVTAENATADKRSADAPETGSLGDRQAADEDGSDSLDIDSLKLGTPDGPLAQTVALESRPGEQKPGPGNDTKAVSDIQSTGTEVSLASAEDAPKQPAALAQPTREQRLQQAITQGVELIKNRQFGRASVILSRSSGEFADSKALMLLRCVALLENQKIAEAGELLVADQFADAEDDVWQALFVSWILSANPQQRAEIRGELDTICSTRSASDPLSRCISWIDARDRKYRIAGRVLMVEPLFGSRSFADALFYCISLYGAGHTQPAREMLDYSRKQFEAARLGVIDTIGDSDSPEVIAISWCESSIKSTLNSFAAKLR